VLDIDAPLHAPCTEQGEATRHDACAGGEAEALQAWLAAATVRHGAHRGPPASRHHGALAIPDGVRPTGIPSPILPPMARPTLLKRVGGCA